MYTLQYTLNVPVDDKIKTYCSMTEGKIRNLEEQVKNQYFKWNNLNPKLRAASYDLNKKVKKKEIVICKSDKIWLF